MKRSLVAVLIPLLLVPAIACAQGVPLKSGDSADLARVNSKKALYPN